MNQDRLPRVLLLYRRIIPSIRLCGHVQMEELMRKQLIEYRACQDMHVTNDDLNWADIVLLGRLDSWYELQVTKRLHAAGKYTIYIIDDDLLNVPSNITSATYYNQPQIQRYIQKIIQLSDAILSPSPILMEKYAKNKTALRIEEPAIEPIEYVSHVQCEPIRIGFAGSVDRSGDVQKILGEVLPRISKEYGDRVSIEFFGALPEFAKDLNAKHIPYCQGYESYRRKLNELAWDIGLAPMPDTPFHTCKHYNKFVEYAAAGIVGVYSDLQPYVRIKCALGLDELFTSNDPQEWYQTLKYLIDHEGIRENLRKKLCEYACGPYSVEQTAVDLYDQMKEKGVFAEPQKACKKVRVSLLIKAIGFMHRVYSFLYKYRMRRKYVVG